MTLAGTGMPVAVLELWRRVVRNRTWTACHTTSPMSGPPGTLLRLGDHSDRDPEAGPALERRHQRPLTDRRVGREPLDPLLVERVELGRVAERPVRPDDLVERAAGGLEL